MLLNSLIWPQNTTKCNIDSVNKLFVYPEIKDTFKPFIIKIVKMELKT